MGLGLLALGEMLLLAVLALGRLVSPPAQRRPMLVLWAACHLLPAWWAWRALWGWVLLAAGRAAERACDRHERAQAVATFPVLSDDS